MIDRENHELSFYGKFGIVASAPPSWLCHIFRIPVSSSSFQEGFSSSRLLQPGVPSSTL